MSQAWATMDSMNSAESTIQPGSAIRIEEFVLSAVEPYDRDTQWGFLARHVIAGVDSATPAGDGAPAEYCCAVRTPSGPGLVLVRFDAPLRATIAAPDPDQLRPALGRLLDLDADPALIDQTLGRDPRIAASVQDHPGVRLPGAIEVTDLCLRTVIGQQVSIAAATTARLTQRWGDELPADLVVLAAQWGHQLTRLPLTPAQVAVVDDLTLPMPRSKARALVGVARALVDGTVVLDPADPVASRRSLEQLRGVGPWTSGYVALRGLGDRDVELPADLIIRRERERLGLGDAGFARPYRSHLILHLWLLSGVGG